MIALQSTTKTTLCGYFILLPKFPHLYIYVHVQVNHGKPFQIPCDQEFWFPENTQSCALFI